MKAFLGFFVCVFLVGCTSCILDDSVTGVENNPAALPFAAKNVAYFKFQPLEGSLDEAKIPKIFRGQRGVHSFQYDSLGDVCRVEFEKGVMIDFDRFLEAAKNLRQHVAEVHVDFVGSVDWVVDPTGATPILGMVLPQTRETYYLAGGYDDRSQTNYARLKKRLQEKGESHLRVQGFLYKRIGGKSDTISVKWYQLDTEAPTLGLKKAL